ncbi:FAD-dependent monooxygenase [Burkholderia pseudomultivorans]|uniref:FAD-binding domain-containing protein n=1 Tax=Burkholderia pseudomultivorans TaxID=1207504 RepID=A0A132EW98_9BURK|nr:FAD-dependent monooxygenase [Burkholderia pseudomultivorans]KWF60979.1 hypothetical protein WT57_02770 [Burkholderia pseudomultivorans]
MHDTYLAPDISVRKTDVLIIGAGPTGLTLANTLGASGIKTIVIDKKPGPVEDPRAVSVDDAALRVMQSLRLCDEVLADGVPGTGMRFRGASGQILARVASSVSELGYPKRTNVHQPIVEATLLEGLTRFDSVDVLFGHELRSIAAGECGAGFETPAIADVVGPDGAPMQIHARIVAACDGGRSFTRKLLGIQMDGRTFEQRWLVLDTIDPQNTEQESDVYCDPARPRVRIPGPRNHVRWEFMIRASEDSNYFLESGYRALLNQYRGSDDVSLASKRVYTFHARMARHWSVGNIYLLGDAAHLNPPFGGQGMINGIRDAANFGWKCVAILKKNFAPALLSTYETERRCSMQDSIDFSLKMGNLMMPSGRLSGWLNAMALAIAFKIPSMRDHIVQQKHRPKPRLGDGFVTSTSARHPAGSVGRMLPQPVVVDSSGTENRLDSALGTGFALIGDDPLALWRFFEGNGSRLKRLAPELIALSHQRAPNESGTSVRVLKDVDGTVLSMLKALPGSVLLVRPDRYIAASFSMEADASEVDAFFDTVQSYLPTCNSSNMWSKNETAVI